MLEHEGPWTFEEFVHLEGEHGERFELVDGVLLVSPPPPVFHQAVARRIFRQLDAQCPGDLEVVYEVAVRLGRDGRVPDLSVVRRSAPTGRGVAGYEPADVVLAVEVVSPSSRTNDRLLKPAHYAAAGIPAYWRVETDPAVELVAFALQADAYVERVRAAMGVVDLPGGWSIDLDVVRQE
jgi:Uma2 family endonuclease